MRRPVALPLTATIVAALVGGCRAAPATPADGGQAALAPGQSEAEVLGREIFELVDRAADYKGSHRGRNPTSLRQIGTDSLTAQTARWISAADGSTTVTVLFRQAAGRTVTGCWAGENVLEEAALHGGRFAVTCSGPSGRAMTFDVGGVPPR